MLMMNQVIVTVGYVEHHLLMKELVVVLLGLNKLLLPSNLQNFTVRIGVLAAVFFPELDVVMSDSEDDEMAGVVVAALSTEGERDTKRRDVQLHGAAARERLLLALAGTAAAISGLKVVAGLHSRNELQLLQILTGK
nr:hypothetical protein Iba_chr01dCG2460 [Ipomoea batatas]